MSLNKKQLAHFDQPETLLVVSLYPKKGETYSAGTTGVASYTKNVVSHLHRPVVILANFATQPKIYQETNALVVRSFKSGHQRMWLQLIKQLAQFKQAHTVLIQFDFSMYGNPLVTINLLTLLFVLKVMGFQTSVVSHHVITDVEKIAGHVGLSNSFTDRFKAHALNIAFAGFYLALGLLTKQVIVLEDILKLALSKYIAANKIISVPHAVDIDLKKVGQTEARQKLNLPQTEQIVMFFGFMNWFKGADFFTETFSKVSTLNGTSTRFILAGGESATLKNKAYYQDFVQKVIAPTKTAQHLQITGYIPQDLIKDYFAAADLVIFPYRYFMCASGVLSLVFSYQKPFIISEALLPMFESSDLAAVMKKVGLSTKDISFKLNRKACLSRTEKVLENGLKAKMSSMGKIISQQRSFEKTALLYDQALFTQSVMAPAEVVPQLAFES